MLQSSLPLSPVPVAVTPVAVTREPDSGTWDALRTCLRLSRGGFDTHATAPSTMAAAFPTIGAAAITPSILGNSPRLCAAVPAAQSGAAVTRLRVTTARSRVASTATVARDVRLRTFKHGRGKEDAMPFYQPKASELAGHLLEFRLRSKQRDFAGATAAAREAEDLIDDFDRWRKKHKKIIDMWESDDDNAA